MNPRVRLTVCDAGPLAVDRSDLMVGESGPLTVPSTVVVVEHARHGLILFDTGINPPRYRRGGRDRPVGPGAARTLRGNRIHT